MKKKTRKKYGTGTAVVDYMENPYSALQQHKINNAKAASEAENNPLWKGMDMVGNMAMQYGINQGGFGESALGELGNSALPILGNMEFANGGQVPDVPVEVEGKEVGELPNGELLDFKGPSHEEGGINVDLPGGTEIFSDRVKIKGKSMADRKKARQKRETKVTKKSKGNPTDALLKNTLKRTKTTNEVQDKFDRQVQEIITGIENLGNDTGPPQQGGGLPPEVDGEFAYGGKVSYAGGGTVIPPEQWLQDQGIAGNYQEMLASGEWGDKYGANYNAFLNNPFPGVNQSPQVPNSPSIPSINAPGPVGIDLQAVGTPQSNSSPGVFDNLEFNDPTTFGDKVGLAGDLISTFSGKQNTLENRAQDTPNINPYVNYGQKGLQTLDKTKGMVGELRDSQLADLQLSKTAQLKRGRNSARGVNTQRALDLAGTQQADQAAGKINDAYTGQLMDIFGQQAGMENQQDKIVMSGEGARDLADRQDTDNFYTQLGKDKASIGTGLQETGKDLNAIKQNQMIENLIGQLSKYGITIDDKGTLTTNK
jgi:hypothetical protein